MSEGAGGDLVWERYQRANHEVDAGLIRVIPPTRDAALPSPRDWMRQRLLPALDHPEGAFRAIHVTGTAGKGSVATMIAEILRAAGYRCGLHRSPYVQVATENLWVDGSYASADDYVELVDTLRPLAEALRGPTVPLRNIVAAAMALEHFRRRRVEVAVVEVGAGGRFDATNVLRTAVAVLTNVGHDHLETLGPTLDDVAWHKVGVIRGGCSAVVFADDEDDPLWRAAQRRAQEVGAILQRVCSSDLRYRAASDGTACVTLPRSRCGALELPLALSGRAQARNAALAVAACERFDPGGSRIGPDALRQGLAQARLPARGEWIDDAARQRAGTAPRVLLDGAHNPEKLGALQAVLQEPVARQRARLHLLLGALRSKLVDEACAALAREADRVTLTEPGVYGKEAYPADALAERLRAHTRHPPAVEANPGAALARALAEARADDLLVISGSLYLAGTLRERWYPAAEVLLSRTSWPSEPG